MRAMVDKVAPRGPRVARLRLAVAMWGLVGMGLLLFGVVNLLPLESGPALGWSFLAVAVGLFKGQMVLGRSARRTIERVEAQPPNFCLFSFFSWKTWGLVLVMMAMGRLLRKSALPPLLIYNVYVAVGTALLFGTWMFGRLLGGRGGLHS